MDTGLTIPNSENLAVEVLDDGIVRISGRRITGPDTFVDLVETLQLQGQGDDLVLRKAGIERTTSDGVAISNERTYTPPVMFLKQRENLPSQLPSPEDPTRGEFTTRGVTVDFQGDQESYSVSTDEGETVTPVAGLSNITTTIRLVDQKSVIVNGMAVDAYGYSSTFPILPPCGTRASRR